MLSRRLIASAGHAALCVVKLSNLKIIMEFDQDVESSDCSAACGSLSELLSGNDNSIISPSRPIPTSSTCPGGHLHRTLSLASHQPLPLPPPNPARHHHLYRNQPSRRKRHSTSLLTRMAKHPPKKSPVCEQQPALKKKPRSYHRPIV